MKIFDRGMSNSSILLFNLFFYSIYEIELYNFCKEPENEIKIICTAIKPKMHNTCTSIEKIKIKNKNQRILCHFQPFFNTPSHERKGECPTLLAQLGLVRFQKHSNCVKTNSSR